MTKRLQFTNRSRSPNPDYIGIRAGGPNDRLLALSGFQYHTAGCITALAGEILLQADSDDCDMVIMGTHGCDAFTDVMIGSTARRVLRRCKKPVPVVRLPED